MISPEEIDVFQEIGILALKNAFQTHEDLGESGREDLQKNQFGDTAMRGDFEAEEAVIEVLRQNNFSVKVYSEEHGIVDVSNNPKFLAVLDGIDGSSWYKSAWGVGRYATMFGIYEGLNPYYGDYLFGGIMEHATKRLFYATKGKGSFVLDLKDGKTKPIKTSDIVFLKKDTRIHIDQYWEINNKVFTANLKGYNIQKYNRCSAYHYANVASGDADLALECTRKGNLEIAAAYPIIIESGGEMISIKAENLKDKKFLEFGQEEHMPVITAATGKLAIRLIEYLRTVKS